MDDRTAVEEAPAKLNLGLRVVGRRADGYHEIRTIMQTVDLCDELTVRPDRGDAFTCDDTGVPAGPENLVCRARDLFRQRVAAWPHPVSLRLTKRIPVGAGLGGGSSDAAAALRALNGLHGHPLDGESLRAVAAELGSDVPFLVDGGTALAAGRGERLTPLVWTDPVAYVLAYPGVAVGTAWAYAQLGSALTDGGAYISFTSSLESGGCVDREALIRVLENDFQPVVERAYPIVAEVRSRLDRAGARASTLSGSGSTVYGIFDDRNAALGAHLELQAQGIRSFLCRPRSTSAS